MPLGRRSHVQATRASISCSCMVWFFEKDSGELRLEVRLDRETQMYSIVRHESSGNVTCINALGEAACRRLLQSMEWSWKRRAGGSRLPSRADE